MYDWTKTLVNSSDRLRDVIGLMDKEALKILLVIDQFNRLLGTVTDGDIRRALIKRQGLESLVGDVMCSNPVTAHQNLTRDQLLKLMKVNSVDQIPIVTDHGCLVGLETIHHLLVDAKFDNIVFIMAGGFGKRLQPLTNHAPKPLLKVGGKPVLETIINQFSTSGFSNFYISTHYKGEMIRSYFSNGDNWGVSINYINEDVPLGTAGALGLLPSEEIDVPMIVINGDLLTKIDPISLLDFHRSNGGVATMCVREYDVQVPYGVVKSDAHTIKEIIEKPVHSFFVNAGIYVLEPHLLKSIKSHQYLDMTSLLQNQIFNGFKVNMFPIYEYWLDIGQIDNFKQAQIDSKGF